MDLCVATFASISFGFIVIIGLTIMFSQLSGLLEALIFILYYFLWCGCQYLFYKNRIMKI